MLLFLQTIFIKYIVKMCVLMNFGNFNTSFGSSYLYIFIHINLFHSWFYQVKCLLHIKVGELVTYVCSLSHQIKFNLPMKKGGGGVSESFQIS